MKRFGMLAGLVWAGLSASVAMAHPGHGVSTGQGGVAEQVQHQLSEPVHQFTWVVFAFIVAAAVVMLRKTKARRLALRVKANA